MSLDVVAVWRRSTPLANQRSQSSGPEFLWLNSYIYTSIVAIRGSGKQEFVLLTIRILALLRFCPVPLHQHDIRVLIKTIEQYNGV